VPEIDLLSLFVRPLHKASLSYLIVGSVGSIYYGEPRLTLDVDFAVAFSDRDLQRLPELFSEKDFYLPPIETLLEESSRPRGHWNIIHSTSGLKADFYPCSQDPFFQWAWQNRRTTALPQGEVFFAPAEYIVVWKVIWYSEGGSDKHVRDISRMLQLSPQQIDLAIIEKELSRRNLLPTFHKMIRS